MSVVRRSFDRSGLSISLHRRRPSEEQQFINLVNVYTAILPKISQEMEHEISRSIVSRQEKVAKKHEFRSKFNFSLKSLAWVKYQFPGNWCGVLSKTEVIFGLSAEDCIRFNHHIPNNFFSFYFLQTCVIFWTIVRCKKNLLRKCQRNQWSIFILPDMLSKGPFKYYVTVTYFFQLWPSSPPCNAPVTQPILNYVMLASPPSLEFSKYQETLRKQLE